MFEAVVFDMDGVIFDTEKLYRRFYLEEGDKQGVPQDVMVRACEQIAGGRKDENKPKFESIVGRGIDYYEFREGVMSKLEDYINHNTVDVKLGVLETLEFLKENNFKVALATSTKQQRATKYLTEHNMMKYFDKLVFGDSISRSKPHPDIYLKACEELGVEPSNAIAIEDSINGIISAGRAGMFPIMAIDLIPPNDQVREYAKLICNNMLEVKTFIEGLSELTAKLD